MTTNEFELIRELTEVAKTVAELKAENRTLKDINEKLMKALRRCNDEHNNITTCSCDEIFEQASKIDVDNDNEQR